MPEADRSPNTAAEWIDRHRTTGDFERVGYIGLGEKYNKHLYTLRRRHFRRLAGRIGIAPPMRALDIGSGTGFYVELLQSLGITDITGVEISPDAVERLKETFVTCQFATADITKGLPPTIKQPIGSTRDGSETGVKDRVQWNIVTAMDVLFHITEDALFEKALSHCAEAVATDGLLLISDNFPKHRVPADASQAYRTMADHLRILEPLGFSLQSVSPVFFLSNGQVPGNGLLSHIAAMKWRLFSRCLGKAIRVAPSLGEALGSLTGGVLTALDALLQRQHYFKGYSTKIAVFRRSSDLRS